MSASDKSEALDNWKQVMVKVMVCTSAFGMGIDQLDGVSGVHPHLNTLIGDGQGRKKWTSNRRQNP